MNFKEIFSLIKETFQEWSEDKAPRLAAALAYYTVFALAPLLVLVISIAGFVVGNNMEMREAVISQVQGLVGEQAATAVNNLIEATNQPREGIIATVVGIATLIFAATGLFGQLQEALNTIWEVKPREGRGIMGIIKDRFLSFTMVLGVSFLLLVSLVISAMLALVNNYFTDLLGSLGIVAQLLNFAVSTAVITLIFALIFKILPDIEIAWGDVWIGALVTALLFNIGKSLIGLYLGNSAVASTYGAAGSIIVILLWVYYSAQILFLGAEFTQVYARRYGSRLEPAENARRLTEDERVQQGIPRKRLTEQNLQQTMIPVAGQPKIYAEGEDEPELHFERERVRYEPKWPGIVAPFIALGAVSGFYTLGRVIRRAVRTITR